MYNFIENVRLFINNIAFHFYKMANKRIYSLVEILTSIATKFFKNLTKYTQ